MSALMRLGLIAGIAAGLLAGQPVIANDDPVLETTEPWRLDLGEDRCRMIKKFGSEGQRYIIYFEQVAPSSEFLFHAAGPKLLQFRRAHSVDIASGEKSLREGAGRIGVFGDFGMAVYAPDLTIGSRSETEDNTRPYQLIDAGGMEGADHIRLRWGDRSLKLVTGDLKAPFEALNWCAEQLLVDHGLDIGQQRSRQTLPEMINQDEIYKNLANYYPMSAVIREREGAVKVRLIIDDQGVLEDCHVFDLVKFSDLGGKVCGEIGKGQFKPALGGRWPSN